MLTEHCFDALAALAVDASASFRPEFPLHALFQPVPLGDTPSWRIRLSKLFPSFPVFGRGDKQFRLLIR